MYSEPVAYSEPCQKSTMERFTKKVNGYNYLRKLQLLLQYQLFMSSTLWNEYHDLFNTSLIFTLEISRKGQRLGAVNNDILGNFVKEHVSHNFTKYFSAAQVIQIVNTDLNGESSCLSNLSEVDEAGNHRIRMFLKLWHCQIVWYLFAGFKTIILCSVPSIWFVIYVFSGKICYMKTSTRVVKYESRVVKSNPGSKSWTHFLSRLLPRSRAESIR